MQQPLLAASTARHFLAPHALQVAIRSSGGDGCRVFVVDAPAHSTVADVKRLLCLPPHSMCSDASALELVLKGEGAAYTAVCNALWPASHAVAGRLHFAR